MDVRIQMDLIGEDGTRWNECWIVAKQSPIARVMQPLVERIRRRQEKRGRIFAERYFGAYPAIVTPFALVAAQSVGAMHAAAELSTRTPSHFGHAKNGNANAPEPTGTQPASRSL